MFLLLDSDDPDPLSPIDLVPQTWPFCSLLLFGQVSFCLDIISIATEFLLLTNQELMKMAKKRPRGFIAESEGTTGASGNGTEDTEERVTLRRLLQRRQQDYEYGHYEIHYGEIYYQVAAEQCIGRTLLAILGAERDDPEGGATSGRAGCGLSQICRHFSTRHPTPLLIVTFCRSLTGPWNGASSRCTALWASMCAN